MMKTRTVTGPELFLIAGTRVAEDERDLRIRPRRQDLLDRPHGAEEPPLISGRGLAQERCDLLVGATVERPEDPPPLRGEGEKTRACVVGRGRARDEPLPVEPLEDPAHVTAVDPEVERDAGGGDGAPARDLVQDPDLGQGVVAAERVLAQDTDLLRVEPVEASDPVDGLSHDG